VLLLVVVAFAAMAAFRLLGAEPAPVPAAPATMPAAIVTAALPDTATPIHAVAPPHSAACNELLARIRTCSEQDLTAIIDKVDANEAVGLYSRLSIADRQAVFAALPMPVLARKAHDLLGVPENCFRDAVRPGLLASSLLDAAVGQPTASGSVRHQALRFTTALDDQGAPRDPRDGFRPGDRRIYACLDAGSESDGEAGVLVRWTAEASGAIVYLHYLPLDLNRRWNYVYFEVTGAWAPGAYRVGFYRIGESAGLLADGTYVITAGG
jgi:hypothetical protein